MFQKFGLNQTYKIEGTSVFGASPTNDLTFTIAGINSVVGGQVTSVSAATGTANTGTGNALNVAGSNRAPIGVGAQFSITRTNDTDSSTDYTEVTVVQDGSNWFKLDQTGTNLFILGLYKK